MRSTAAGLCLLCVLTAAPALCAPADPPVVLYHVHPGDTLIGIGRRLLVPGHSWREIAALNQVSHERRLAPDSILRIPIDWLRWQSGSTRVLDAAGGASAGQKPLQGGELLPEGSGVRTGERGSAALELPDGSKLSLPQDSELLLEHTLSAAGTDAPDIRLRLPKGQVNVSAVKHRDTGRFEIHTPTALTAVRGTEFRTHFSPSEEAATAETLSGTVAVASPAGAQAIGAGFGTRAEADRAPLPPVPLLSAPLIEDLAPLNETPLLHLRFVALSQAVGYKVELSTREDFSVLEASVRVALPEAEISALPDGTHFVRVRGIDAQGLEGFDATGRFSQHTLPPAPQALAPTAARGARGEVRFSWEGKAPAFMFGLFSADSIDRPLIERRTDSSSVSVQELTPGEYRWRVASINATNTQGPWGEWQAYTARPPAPELVPPQLSRRHEAQLEAPAPEGYEVEVQLAHDQAFTRLAGQGVVRADAPWHSAHLRPGSYYARARLKSSSGDYEGPFGPARPLTVPPPPWVYGLVGVVAIAILW